MKDRVIPKEMNDVMCSIDWGLVISAIAAFGSVGAAAIALYIATADRRERKRERNAAAAAQAKLVIVKVGLPTGYREGLAPEFPVVCENHSGLPILDVKLESAKMRAFPQASSTLSEFVSRIVLVGDDASFATKWVDENGEPFPLDRQQRSVKTVDIEAVVSFSDANGTHWQRSNAGMLKRLSRGGSRHG